jgi:hypothetical protein
MIALATLSVKETIMSLRIVRSGVCLWITATGTLFLAVIQTPAQCQSGSQQQAGSSGSTGTQLTNTAQRQGRNAMQRQQAAARNALQRQQQSAFLQQAAFQQQIALQNLLAQQQVLAAQQQPQPQQNSLGVIRQGPQQQQQLQRVAMTQPLAASQPAASAIVPQPVDPEEAASRQLRIARALAADAETASLAGDSESATRLRLRVAERLQRITSRYPETQAADEAEKLMRKIQ